ncbi:retinol dehydrogenase 13-like isoform X2 [Homalodisca vitripennis]|uniref:retinol dehydrogenase 13-like isoform X2 n=1 Tax=Homalodisca vitripennis TaxID=197043 RepID=UPI001EECC8E4|nr:retinol dehydrogenase 13-like isoform X2 [Homalodisca vitripennis]
MHVWRAVCEHYIVSGVVVCWCAVWLYILTTRRACTSKARLDGKTVIITGSNSGIGKATALDLASRGARVIMACRNVDRALQVRKHIADKTRNNNIIVKSIDLSDMLSVRQFAEDINRTEPRLDVLIHNAGVLIPEKLTTDQGLNTIFATNHFGPFLFTHLLMAHSIGKLDLSNPNPKKDASTSRLLFSWNMYCSSKLACVLCARELARRLEGSGVTANCLHPGYVYTSILCNPCPNTVAEHVFTFLFPLIMTKRQGAQTTIHLAVSEELERVSGKYFSNCMEKTPGNVTGDVELAGKYWRLCEAIVGLNSTFPQHSEC